jgi:hypothetical protein
LQPHAHARAPVLSLSSVNTPTELAAGGKKRGKSHPAGAMIY